MLVRGINNGFRAACATGLVPGQAPPPLFNKNSFAHQKGDDSGGSGKKGDGGTGGDGGGKGDSHTVNSTDQSQWGEHDPNVQQHLMDEAEKIREKNGLTSNRARKSNIGFANYTIDGEDGYLQAYSRDKHIDGFVDSPASGLNHFETVSDSPNPDGSSGNDRQSDTEYKILEQIASRYWSDDPTQRVLVSGDVYLFTERMPCRSCEGVIEQFKEAFPNIRIHVEWYSDTPTNP
jgi:hypothetical protein